MNRGDPTQMQAPGNKVAGAKRQYQPPASRNRSWQLRPSCSNPIPLAMIRHSVNRLKNFYFSSNSGASTKGTCIPRSAACHLGKLTRGLGLCTKVYLAFDPETE